MTPGSFYYKKDLNEEQLKETIEVSTDVVFFPKDTIVGKSHPDFFAFYEFIKEPIFTVGAGNYNSLGLDTQVAARINYATRNKIETKIKHWNIIYIRTSIEEKYFDLFAPVDFVFFDCLTHFDHIGDGYYPDRKSLMKGIVFSLGKVRDRGHVVNWELVLKEAILVKPELKKYLKILK